MRGQDFRQSPDQLRTSRQLHDSMAAPSTRYPRASRVAWTIASTAALVGLYNAEVGPFRFEWHRLVLGSHDPVRAALIGSVAAATALWLEGSTFNGTGAWWRRVSPSVAAAALACLVAGFGLRHMTAVASASDAYGYVSQAMLWSHGQLRQPEPLTMEPLLGRGGAPLGYVIDMPGTMVPVYPPGLPLLMAAAALVGGDSAVYVVVPLLGALTVWLTFVLGRRLVSAGLGLASALLMATGPMFVFQLFAPMSDVPATCWWLAALVAALNESAWSGALSGAAVAAAVLTRPNLLPLAAPIACLLLLKPSRVKDLAGFGATTLLGVLILAAITTHLYGSPFRSGYGALSDLFRLSWLGVNARNYAVWLLDVYGPFVLIGIVAPWVVRHGVATERAAWLRPRGWALVIFAIANALCYLAYLPMDGWPSVRFLLPAIPVLTVLGCLVVRVALQRAPSRARLPIATIATALLATWYLSHAQKLGAFAMAAAEQRYVAVGGYIDRALPANAVVLSGLHSGTSRLYGHRTSVQWTEIAPGDLTRALDLLRSHGLEPFIVLDESEEPLFRERFTNDGRLGALAWQPRWEYEGHPVVRVYDTRAST